MGVKQKFLLKKKESLSINAVALLNIEQTRVQLDLVEKAFDACVQENDALVVKANDDKVDDLIDEAEKFSEIYVNLKSILLEHLHSFDHRGKLENISHKLHEDAYQNVRLPPIDIPRFSGNFQDWYSYRDQFMSVVHNNKGIDDVHKMYYLKASLDGQAAEVIAALPATEINYKEAWLLLTSRYDNKRLIIQTHLQLLLSPPVANETVHTLRKLLDTTNKHLAALKVLELPVEHWDAVLVHIVTTRLPSNIRQAWEIKCCQLNDLPTWQECYEFIENHIHALDIVQLKSNVQHKVKTMTRIATHTATTQQISPSHENKTCPVCNQRYHTIYNCQSFMQATPKERKVMASKAKLCLNCLWPSHFVNQCSSAASCKTCSRKHHTLLHFEFQPHQLDKNKIVVNSTSDEKHSTENILTCHGTVEESTALPTVLLSTALIKVHGTNGKTITCRALLDSGSQSHFVTTAIANRLRLKRKNQHVIVDGVSNAFTSVSEIASFDISSCVTPKRFTLDALVTMNITKDLPTNVIDIAKWDHIADIPLADPTFHLPGRIDILIGAELFLDTLKDGSRKGTSDIPTVRNSEFGWLVGGKHNMTSSMTNTLVTCCTTNSLNNLVKKFWEIEEVSRPRHISREDAICEEHFKNTHQRDSSGRYVVRLPFKIKPPDINHSYQMSVQRLYKVERFLTKNIEVSVQYKQFLRDYESAGHMEKIDNADTSPPTVYIPHHHICRPSSTTTKLRVVFDGSSKIDKEHSLNDTLHTGPKLQRDIVSILSRFRLHQYVFTADIKQMFRQISIHQEDRQYQCIVWRDHPSKAIESYRLNTVTYGLVTSPYLALRVLHQLADDERQSHSVACDVLTQDFYVDEVMTGADTLEDASNLRRDLATLLLKGGFELRKWASNHVSLLRDLPAEFCVTQSSLPADKDQTIKILGVGWNAQLDTFTFNVSQPSFPASLTKRSLLSEIAQVYDPCGWLAPLTITSKLIMQELWKTSLSWDDSLPEPLLLTWKTHRLSYECLNDFDIPRRVTHSVGHDYVCSLHGFSDSSEKAYAAAVYLVCSSAEHTTSHLLTSKTRVAPLKQLSIPRLELCGAVLLTELITSMIHSLNKPLDSVNLWTDSTITLQWINNEPSRWTTFVANRVAQIQTLLPNAVWRHVPSLDNPADIASRGMSGDQLIHCQLWWNGPTWVTSSNELWPLQPDLLTSSNAVIEEKPPRVLVAVSCQDSSILNKYSNLERLLRITSLLLRFYYNIRKKSSGLGTYGPITVKECRQALHCWIRHVQHVQFTDEIHRLHAGKPVQSQSQLKSLAPFLDTTGLLRVGGRLSQSKLVYDTKHPILLPKSSVLTDLLVTQVHLHNLHSGVNTTMSILREKYWIIHGRSTVKRILHRCLRCYKFHARNCKQIMADLPAFRVTPAPAFRYCGVDYAGPFNTKVNKGRCRTTSKSYLALFICLTTKAVHLEVVSDLTTDQFIAALKRFIARRGYPNSIHSDNGTNFVGTHNRLHLLYKLLHETVFQEQIYKFCLPKEIDWKFIPPSSPHFGGLWEASVKACKSILQRVTGSTVYTFEELGTLFCQIEATLNSRPLCAKSMEATDYTALTPGHFLVGRPLLALPDHDFTSQPMNRLTRWKLVQQTYQSFWKQWSSDYLTTLQQRTKWQKSEHDLQINDLVVIRENNTPPSCWPLARVIEVHPSQSDQRVRVVTLRTSTSTFKRPCVKLIRLPIN